MVFSCGEEMGHEIDIGIFSWTFRLEGPLIYRSYRVSVSPRRQRDLEYY